MLAILGLVLSFHGTQDVVANGDTRTIDLYHTHTKESLRITFRRDGAFDNAALEKLNWFLRDWRMDEPTTMAPELFDIVWYAAREAGGTEPIRVVSAYRSPGTNAMLARRSRAVAKNSQHMRGNAMDFHIPGIPMSKVREIAMRLQRGGVGYYPSAGTPFVHLDVGSVRSWPRMPRDQLERLFPDGKTVHIPADGVPLANYEAALAEVQARGGSALDFATVNANRGKSLWALLFGSGDEDEDTESSRSASSRSNAASRTRVASAAPLTEAPITGQDNPMKVTAYAPEPAASSSPPRIASATLSGAASTLPDIAPQKPEETTRNVAIDAPFPPFRPKGSELQAMLASIAPLNAPSSAPLPPLRPAGLGSSVNAAQPPEVTPPSPQAVAGVPMPPLRPALVASAAPASRSSAPTSPATEIAPTPRPATPPALTEAPASPPLDRAALAVAALRAAQEGDVAFKSGRFTSTAPANTPPNPPKAPTAFLNQTVFTQ